MASYVPLKELLKDPEFLKDLANGDQEAWKAFYSSVYWVMFKESRKYVDDCDAEDVVQKAFIVLLRKCADWTAFALELAQSKDIEDAARAAYAFMRKAVYHASRRIRREMQRGKPVSLDEPIPGGSEKTVAALLIDDSWAGRPSVDHAIENERLESLACVISQLPDRQRQTILCIFYFDMTLAKTAERLGISVAKVKTGARTHSRRCFALNRFGADELFLLGMKLRASVDIALPLEK